MKCFTGACIVYETLKYFNVSSVFGYPGGAAMPIYDKLKNYNIKHFLTTHEQSAVHAAEGYARTSGNVGVVFATSGPGATNTITGIADAKLDSVPIVVITSNVASHLIGTDAFQEVDICSIAKKITKETFFVNRVNDIQNALFNAFKLSTHRRHGPVLVDITKDSLINTYDLINFSEILFTYDK